MCDPKTKWKLAANQETIDLQREGNFEKDETTSKRIQCLFCSMDLVAGTTFCVRGAKETYLPKGQEEQERNSVQKDIAFIQAFA